MTFGFGARAWPTEILSRGRSAVPARRRKPLFRLKMYGGISTSFIPAHGGYPLDIWEFPPTGAVLPRSGTSCWCLFGFPGSVSYPQVPRRLEGVQQKENWRGTTRRLSAHLPITDTNPLQQQQQHYGGVVPANGINNKYKTEVYSRHAQARAKLRSRRKRGNTSSCAARGKLTKRAHWGQARYQFKHFTTALDICVPCSDRCMFAHGEHELRTRKCDPR